MQELCVKNVPVKKKFSNSLEKNFQTHWQDFQTHWKKRAGLLLFAEGRECVKPLIYILSRVWQNVWQNKKSPV